MAGEGLGEAFGEKGYSEGGAEIGSKGLSEAALNGSAGSAGGWDGLGSDSAGIGRASGGGDGSGRTNDHGGASSDSDGSESGGESAARGASGGNGTEGGVSSGAADDFERQLAERDVEIAALRAQVAEAAKTAEATDALNARIQELEAKAATERVDFELRLAGCRSTRAARALLDDHKGDVGALKEAEPWLFDDGISAPRGVTGLPNAGAATGDEAAVKRWREIAGLED